MKLYRLAILKDKHPRDSNQFTTFYHISPNHLSMFSPRSNFFGHKGVYLSPSYRSLIRDWAHYVFSKKGREHPLRQRHKSILRQLDKLRSKPVKTPEDDAQLTMLHEQLDRVNNSMAKESFQKTDTGYNNLYIHYVSVPLRTMQIAQELYNQVWEAKQPKNDDSLANFGFWGWGEQLFFPDYLLNDLRIYKVEKIRFSDFLNLYDQSSKKEPTLLLV